MLAQKAMDGPWELEYFLCSKNKKSKENEKEGNNETAIEGLLSEKVRVLQI